MKATLLLTTACNLRCDYCYVRRENQSMTDGVLENAIDFAFQQASQRDRLDIGLFGGEPMLEWPLVKKAVRRVEQQAGYVDHDVRLSLVTNGTLLTPKRLDYLRNHPIILQVSCDGPPHVQDRHRCFPDGQSSAALVETHLAAAYATLPAVLVNMVFGPDTYPFLCDSIRYLTDLGARQVILNPDYGADWSEEDIAGLKSEFRRMADLYLEFYASGKPVFISLIDEKIAVILRGGYAASERCQMGYAEFAFSPQGYIFPCERLVGSGDWNEHCIGHLGQPYLLERAHCGGKGNACSRMECRQCSVTDFCMNWCGCSNFFATGDYGRPSRFICASERIAIETAFDVLQQVDEYQPLSFINHYAGLPMANSSGDPPVANGTTVQPKTAVNRG